MAKFFKLVKVILYYIAKTLGWVLVGAIVLFIVVVLLIRTPDAQQWIVHKATGFVSEKTNTRVDIERLYLTFDGNLQLDGVYLEDQKADTLLYSRSLEISVALLPLIQGETIDVQYVNWKGLRADIVRFVPKGDFNFSFIIDAFAPQANDTTAVDSSSISQSEPPELKLGKVVFEDFDLTYNDEMLGMESSLLLEELLLHVNQINLDEMVFEIKEFKVDGLTAKYLQYQTLPLTNDTSVNESATPLPKVIVDNLSLSNITALYESKPDAMSADAVIGALVIELPLADIGNQEVKLETFSLVNSKVVFSDFSKTSQSTVEAGKSQEDIDFIWPDWKIQGKKIHLEDNDFELKYKTVPVGKAVFDPSFMILNDINLLIEDLAYETGQASVNLSALSAKERSGFVLKDVHADLKLTNSIAQIQDFIISTNNNKLKGNLALKFVNLNELINNAQKSRFDITLDEILINAKDAYYFVPAIDTLAIVKASTNQNLTGTLMARGSLSQIVLPKAELNWGNTRLKLNGSAKHIQSPDSIYLNIENMNLKTTENNLVSLMPTVDTASFIPSKATLNGNFKGGLEEFSSKLTLNSSLGAVKMDVHYENKDNIVLDGVVTLKEIQLGKALNNNDFHPLTMTLQVDGSGSSLNTLNASVNTDFEQMGYKDYDLTNLSLTAEVVNGEAEAYLNYKDSSLNVSLQTIVLLDTVSPKVDLKLDLKGAALQALGLTQKDIRTAFVFEAAFEGNADSFDANASFSDGLAIYDQRSYPFGTLRAQLHVRDDSTNLEVNSDLLDIDLISNTTPQELNAALIRQFETYLGEDLASDTVDNPVSMRMNLTLREDPLLDQVFVEPLNRFDSISMNVWFEEAKDSLSAHFLAPYVEYGENTIDSIKLDLIANSNQADFQFGWSQISAGPINIGRTTFDGMARRDTFYLDFLAYDEETKLLHIKSEISLTGDTINYSIDPSELILNKLAWNMPETNRITLASEFIEFIDFSITNTNQSIKASSGLRENGDQEVKLDFDGFTLSTFTSFLNAETTLVKGVISGELMLIDPYGKTGLETDLVIKSFAVLENIIGKLSLEGQSTSGDDYDFSLNLAGEEIGLDITGNYTSEEESPRLDLDLNLERLGMELVEKFTQEEITNSRGYLSGNVDISGTLAEPTYKGMLAFNDIGFSVSALNSDFSLPKENIKIDNQGVHLSKFTIVDANKNTFILDGDVFTENLVNPSFSLTLKANNFRAVNAKKGDNELFFGQVFLNADLSIKGNVDVPKIRGSLKVNEGSDLTVIVPETQLSIVDRKGVVVFVNKENPDRIITRVDDDQTIAEIIGVDLYTDMIVEDNSVFRVLIDEQSGDNLEISGRGDFKTGMDPTGRVTLSGRYEVSNGHYRASLYGLVKRKFDLSSESVIIWRGDPLDAKLDVAAIYDVTTSAAPIMATGTTGSSQSTSSIYNAQLPFQVYLNVEGELLKPQLSFELDMPEDSRGELGGDVYSRLQQLNQDESELNKQVFSLLVLNRFFPASGSDGSAGGAEAIARTNVSKVLSGQLNTFSDKLLGDTGFELNFGVNSYTADQSVTGQSGTQLDVTASKKLFDERLVVQVGSEVGIEGTGQNVDGGTPLIGNVSIEYLLTDNGRYRLKGFRKNEFENVIDGQLIVTGIAFIFNREFNRFRELFEETVETARDGEMNKKEAN